MRKGSWLIALCAAFFGTAATSQNINWSSPYAFIAGGTSFETHSFDLQGAAPGQRVKTKTTSTSRDFAAGIGFKNWATLGTRPIDLEFDLFERRTTAFSISPQMGRQRIKIQTQSALISLWTPITTRPNWQLSTGIGLGARQSRYQIKTGTRSQNTTDRAPYAMLGLRLSHEHTKSLSSFVELRHHLRPPLTTGVGRGQPFGGLLEHNSRGTTLRFGLQLWL